MNSDFGSVALRRTDNWLRHWGPTMAALLTVAVVWSLWGSVRPVPIYHDEDSYLLQADILARGKWTVATPPLPEFFEQPHVLSVPAVASKYPPGHALLLMPGAILGWHALVPLLLTAATAALLFAVTTRLVSGFAALFAWLFWLTAPLVLRYQPSYFSQVTTTALVLLAWWSYLRWRDDWGRRWMLVLAFAIAWGGITRPISMLAFAVPLGVLVINAVARRRAWRELAPGVALGLAVFLVVPIWMRTTTGTWSETPVGLYQKQYLPFDKLGFVADSTPPARALTPVVREVYDEFFALRNAQTAEAIPATVGSRLQRLNSEIFRGNRGWCIPVALLGVAVGGPVLQVAATGALLLFLVHVPYAHDATWTLYYLEAVPVVALAAAAGLWMLLRWLTSPGGRRAGFESSTSGRAPVAMLLLCALLLLNAPATIRYWHQRHVDTASFARPFAAAMRALPEVPAIVFVRFSPSRSHYVNVVGHRADLERAAVWVVHDLGLRNPELLRTAPERAIYLFDEHDMRLTR